MIPIEGLHPLEGGMIRLKFRRDRRPDMPMERPLAFYARTLRENWRKAGDYWRTYRLFHKLLDEVRADPNRAAYTDIALTPLSDNEDQSLELFHATRGGEAALERKRRSDAIRAEVELATPAA
jgi:hypothetical protein